MWTQHSLVNDSYTGNEEERERSQNNCEISVSSSYLDHAVIN